MTVPPSRSAAAHATIYPYGPFAAGDGGTVMLGLQNEREWRVFCDVVLAQPALATDPRFDSNFRRNEHRDVLKAIILAAFSSMTTDAVSRKLDEAQIANARMNDMAGLWAHPQLQARDRWRQVATPIGDIPALLPPGRISSFDYRMDPVPAVGQHTEAILRELGQGEADIAALKQANAI
jgi:itaconate CoA-transferase